MPSEQRSQVDALCPTHGAYVSRVSQFSPFGESAPPIVIRSPCPVCAAEEKSERDARHVAAEARDRQRRVDALVGGSGIPARFADRDFTGYIAAEPGQRIALAACRAFADNWSERLQSGASLALTGKPGTGKTHLACAIANQVMRQNLAVCLFGTVATVLRGIKATYNRDSQRTEQDAINALLEPDLLILDEVGVQVGSEHEKMLMFELLNARYQELRPTILISNLTAEELETFLGHRVMDRYRECGSVLAFDWSSHRGARP